MTKTTFPRFLAIFAAICGHALFPGGQAAVAAVEPELFVATDGSDEWSGKLAVANADSTDGPLATIDAARRLVRRLRGEQPNRRRPIVVSVRGGTYRLSEPLLFSPEDSGTARAPIVYEAFENERPILSGGREISDWKPNEQGHWVAELDEVKRGDWTFTQLFVNDQRRFRPRLPKKGYYKIARQLDPSPKAKGKGHDRFGFAAGEIRDDWANLHDIEVVAFHHWAISRMPVDEVDVQDNAVTVRGHTTGNDWWAQFKQGHRYLIENVKEALEQPGQWYLDRPTGQLTYVPREGETLENTRAVAPRLKHLLLLRGDLENRRWVRHIHFRGLTFAHANWKTPPTGNSFPQAEVNLGAAVAATAARDLVFDRCAIRHVGEYAMGFGPGCRNNRVRRCELVDLGAGGIKIGSALPSTWHDTLSAPKDDETQVSHHAIEDCTIAHAGRMHPAGIGVWVGHSPHNVIKHNHVHDLYYSAFSLGWVWGYKPSRAHHNEVAFNHAHDIGQGVLSDMGCIYTLGTSPGTTIHGNRFHDVVSFGYGGWGLYTDEGSTGVVMRNNLVYRCSRGGFHQHYGKENRIENNIFAFGGQHQIQRTRTESHTSFFFERNIVYWDNGSPLLGSNWKDDNFRMDKNVYWHGDKPVVFPGNLTLKQWREKRGHDKNSFVVDPGFEDPSKDDFRLKPDSPALKVGFQPFDPSKAGRRTPVVLTKDLPPVPRGFE